MVPKQMTVPKKGLFQQKKGLFQKRIVPNKKGLFKND